MTLHHEPITDKAARAFMRHQFGSKLPAGMHWYHVSGLQVNTTAFDASFLVAGDNGLHGIVGFRDEAVAQFEPVALMEAIS